MTQLKVKNQSTGSIRTLKKQSGQIVVEYILLLVVGVAIWLLVVNALVSRNPNSPGVIVKKWYDIIKFIGEDKVEK